MLYDECLINPYENVNWDTAEHIKSMSHMHLTNQESFERAVKDGYRHFPISNYIPAKPTYPLADFFRNVPDDVLGAPLISSETYLTTCSARRTARRLIT